MFYAVIGSRQTGKSYSGMNFMCKTKKQYGDNAKFFWVRISESSTKTLLMNKADKLVDPDLKIKYNLDLTTKGDDVFDRGKLFCTVMPLSKFAKLKGVGYFDKNFKGKIYVFLDEFQLEQGEKRTSFDILYNFMGILENIARNTPKSKLKVFLFGNTLEESSTILKAFNFLPEKFGRFVLHRFNKYTGKREKYAVIDNLEPTDEYLKSRYNSAAALLGGDALSNYSNELTKDISRIDKRRAVKLTKIIKFSKKKNDWYCVWDGVKITRYKNQTFNEKSVVAMIPYINPYYNREQVLDVFARYNAGYYKFGDLITQSYFEGALQTLKKK